MLADDPFVKFIAKVKQFLFFPFKKARNRNSGPAADDSSNIFLIDFFLDQA